MATATAAPTVAGATSQHPGGHHRESGAHKRKSGAHKIGEVSLPDGIRPEGITSGPGQRFYVGSLADGRIVAGDLRSGKSKVLLPGATGRQVRGLFYDDRSGLVWAAGNVGDVGRVWAVDGRTGAVKANIKVEDAVFLNDLVVTRKAVWVTDSRVDRLTVIPLGRSGKPSKSGPKFVKLRGDWPAGNGKDINANGIRQLPDGTAILNNSREGVGGLWQVNPATGVARKIPVSGGPGIVGGDGLELSGRTLFNVRGSGDAEVSVLNLRRAGGHWKAVWKGALKDKRLDVPSTATLVGKTLWAVNARFGTPNPNAIPYWVTPLRVR